MFFKVIQDDKIIGIATDFNFRRHQQKHNLVLFSSVENAQYLDLNGVLFRDNWLRKLTSDVIQYQEATIVAIEEDEYNALSEAFETVGEIVIEPEPEPEPLPEPEEGPDVTLEFVRNAKIEQMSKICHDTIVNGIDVVLSDGESHHFSLEIEDQIKIQSLALKVQNGEQSLPWHEDNKPCCFYSAADIMTIYAELERTQVYHTTYFNSLKMYILALDSIEDIHAVVYGMQIPVEYQSEVMKYLVAQESDGNE